MIADAKNKGHEKVPLVGTQEFLNRGKLCRGVVCVSSNADGLFRVPGMWTKGKDVCDICAESEPVPLRFFSAKKTAQPKPPKPPPAPKPPKPPPPPPKPAKPDKAEVQAMVAAEIARVLPGLVRDEIRKMFAKLGDK